LALTKPEVNLLILVTTFADFYLGSAVGPSGFRIWPVINTLLCTLLEAGGTGTQNQFLERTFDAQMRRTARRPLASGRLKLSPMPAGPIAALAAILSSLVGAISSSISAWIIQSHQIGAICWVKTSSTASNRKRACPLEHTMSDPPNLIPA
jgi:heme O synthase-like polyprenyltransferase